MLDTPILLSIVNFCGLLIIGSILQLEPWTILLVLMITFAFTALILHGRISKRTKSVLHEVLVIFDISSMFVLQLLGYKFNLGVWLCMSLATSAEFYLLRDYLL
jgi:hypothetical protein